MTERAQALEAIDQMLSYMVVNAADRRVLSAEIRLAVYGPPPAGPTRQPDTGPPPPPPPVGSPTTEVCGKCRQLGNLAPCDEHGPYGLSTPVEPAGMTGQVRLCGALHMDTGAVCELPLDHTENHRGSFSRGIAQWPYESVEPAGASEPPPVNMALREANDCIVAIRARLWEVLDGRDLGGDRSLLAMVNRVIDQRDEARENRRGEFDLRMAAERRVVGASEPPSEAMRQGHYYGNPLEASIEEGRLVIAIGIQTLAHATAFADWANPFDEAADDYIRTFAIEDAPQFAKDVVSAMLSEREDGSTPLSDFLDKMAQDAIEDGSLGLHEDEQQIKHGTFAPCETWANAQEPIR